MGNRRENLEHPDTRVTTPEPRTLRMPPRLPLATALMALTGLMGCTSNPPQQPSDPSTASSSPQDVETVKNTLVALDDSWNRHDIQAMAALLTTDVQWIVTNGNCWRSRQAVADAYCTLHQHLAAGSPMATVRTVHVEVQFLAAHTAIGMATLQFGDGSNVSDQDGPGWHTRASFVMTRAGGKWQIAQFHQTMLDPRVAREDPLWRDAAQRQRGPDGQSR